MDLFLLVFVIILSLVVAVIFVYRGKMPLMPQFRTFVNASTGQDEEYDEMNCRYSRFSFGLDQWNRVDANQSPINIMENCVEEIPMKEFFVSHNYDAMPQSLTLENNGHTVILQGSFTRNNWPAVRGAHLTSSYEFVEICFRWGLLSDNGSEHAINSRKFPLEMQTMHIAASSAGRLPTYNILLIACFFQITSHNQYLEPIIGNLHRIIKPGSKIEIPPFPLSFLVHPFSKGFYSYGGSTTEPFSHQSAKWIVFPDPLAISERQINEFWQLLSSDGHTRIIRNSRPIQPLNGTRVVKYV